MMRLTTRRSPGHSFRAGFGAFRVGELSRARRAKVMRTHENR